MRRSILRWPVACALATAGVVDYSLAIANGTTQQANASFNVDGTGRVNNMYLGADTQTLPNLQRTLFLPYGQSGPQSPGLKWTDGTWENTASLSMDGNGPNGLSFQGTTTYPCFLVRAVTGNGTSGTVMARMCANGEIVGSVKNFEEVDPRDPKKRIVYASIEGPEAAMYARGSGSITRDPVTIALPDHFTVLAADEGLTASLTQIGACPGGMYVESRDRKKIVVAREKPDGKACTFDYLVVAVRAKYRDYQVVRDAE